MTTCLFFAQSGDDPKQPRAPCHSREGGNPFSPPRSLIDCMPGVRFPPLL